MSLTVSRVKECFELIHSFIHLFNTGDGEKRRIYYIPCRVLGGMDIAVNKRDKTPYPLGAYIKLELRTKILDIY